MEPVKLLPVLGMHRSGTSAAAGALQILGAQLGDPDDLMAPQADNPKGFYEHEKVVEVNRAVLGMLGGDWRRPPVFVEGWHRDERLQRPRDLARTWLEGVEHSTLVVKDPRMSLLLPFWRHIAEVGPALHVLRDPVAVAASLRRRNALGEEASAELWLRHVVAVLRDAPDATLLLAEDFVEDPVAAMAPYAERLGLTAPADRAEELRRFVDPSMLQEPAEPFDGPRTRAARSLHAALVAGEELDRDLLAALATSDPEASPLPPGGIPVSEVASDLRSAVLEARKRADDEIARFARVVRKLEQRDRDLASHKTRTRQLESDLAKRDAELERLRARLARPTVRAVAAVATRLRPGD